MASKFVAAGVGRHQIAAFVERVRAVKEDLDDERFVETRADENTALHESRKPEA